jgi:5-methylcytosine-specific restriction endonuclease McrA
MLAKLRATIDEARERRRADAAARTNRDQGTNCYYCGIAFSDAPGLDRTIDHRHPRSKGGTDLLINMVFACRVCNERKADRDEDTFAASEWLAERRHQFGADKEGER